MKINCLHGYFMIQEQNVGEVSDFCSLFDFEMTLKDGYYTFTDLIQAPRHSVIGGQYLGAVSTKTFEGEPWRVMRENGLVYNFNTGLVLPIITVTQRCEINSGSNYFLSNGLILPGSVTDDGSRVRDYAAYYSFEKQVFRYSEVSFE